MVAEYLRYVVTGDKDALRTGTRFFEGMVLLNEVTGKKGLMARSACAPDEKGKTCAGPGVCERVS